MEGKKDEGGEIGARVHVGKGGCSRACKQETTKNKYTCEEGASGGQKSVGGESDSCEEEEGWKRERTEGGRHLMNLSDAINQRDSN